MVSWSEGSVGFSQQGAEDNRTVVVCEVDECMEELPGHTLGKPSYSPPCARMLHWEACCFLSFAEGNKRTTKCKHKCLSQRRCG